MTNQTPEATQAPGTLRDADRVLRDGREVKYVWDLGADPDGGTRQAVLAVAHHKRQRGGAFSATVLNQTEDGNVQRMGEITSWTCILTRQAPRYSKRLLDEFAAEALNRLREKHGDDDEGPHLTGYFDAQP